MNTWQGIAVIVATLFGPILAIQVQKYLERRRDAYSRREKVFRTLMATRAARLSPGHVESLNLIDLEFYEPKRRFLKQNQALTRVRSAWRAYLENLAVPYPTDQATEAVYLHARDDLFIDLLYEMATALGYDAFDKTEIRKLSYNPIAHDNIEKELRAIREGFAEVLGGRRSLPMKVTEFPFVPMGTEIPQQAVEPQAAPKQLGQAAGK